MLQLTDVQLAYEGETLFSGVTFHVGPGERAALVGPNGAGKSSLLKIISGEQRATSGSVNLLSGRTVAYLPQDSYVVSERTLHDEMLSVFAHVLENEERQRAVEQAMNGATGENLEHLLEEYATLQAEFDRLGGYTIEREVGTVLHGLGFTPNDTGRRVSHFSGGWKSRIALGKTLLRRPDLLLLDEPTNHLDLATTEWLEEYLIKYSGAFVLVSHDRYFLEHVTTRTLELERGGVTDYPGKYSWYIAEKARRREQQQGQHERQQRELERQQQFIDRFRAKATKAAAVKSREKMVARIERVDAPPPDLRTVKFRFSYAGNSGREVLDVRKLGRSYNDRQVLRDVSFLVERGDKIGVVGPNGSGKTTLVRVLAGIDKPSSGSVVVGHNVRRSYFAQHQAELLESGHTVYDEVVQSAQRGWTVTDVRTLLGRFLFSGDDVQKPIEVLSGGERSRVALVKMLLEPANTLLLDEPTNHLDIATRDVLEDAIRSYEGTCIVISHDRYFLDRISNKTLVVEGGEVSLYPGNYSEYRERKLRADLQPPAPATPTAEPRKQSRSPEKDMRKLRQEVSSLESEIERTEARLEEVQNVLADPSLYNEYERYNALLEEYGELQGRVEDLNERWEHRARDLERLEPPQQQEPQDDQRHRLRTRLGELEKLLEDPNIYANDERGHAILDEYAEVYEALTAANGGRDGRAIPRGAPSSFFVTEEEELRTRLAEVERMLTDPNLFMDGERSAPVVEEYAHLQERLRVLSSGSSGA